MKPAHLKHDDSNYDAEDALGQHEPTKYEPAGETPKTPSWFSRDLSAPAGEALADRYQAQRNVRSLEVETPGPEAYEDYRTQMERRFNEAKKIYDVPKSPPVQPSLRRPTLPLSEIQGRSSLYQTGGYQPEAIRAVRSRGQFSIAQYAALGLIASTIGVVAGLGFSNYDRVAQSIRDTVGRAQSGLAQLTRSSAEAAPHNTETVILKKTVAIATLDVNDVRGTLNNMIPLMLTAQSADETNPVDLKISGLPPTAYLTAGVQTAQGKWLLKSSDIANVKLVVPQSEAKQFDLEVAAVEEKSGALAAPVKALSVQLDGVAVAPPAALENVPKIDVATIDSVATVAPASAAPDTAMIKTSTAAVPASTLEARDMVTKGNALLASGDIASARQFFMRASELGNAMGTYGVGRSYDPKVFAQLNVVGFKPDADKATEWYKKAALAGVVSAQN